MGDDFLAELAAAENEERLRGKQAIDDALEEYLLGRMRARREPGYHAPSMATIAFKYGVKRGVLEHRLSRLRQRASDEELIDGFEGFGHAMGQMLNGMAEAMHEKGSNE